MNGNCNYTLILSYGLSVLSAFNNHNLWCLILIKSLSVLGSVTVSFEDILTLVNWNEVADEVEMFLSTH